MVCDGQRVRQQISRVNSQVFKLFDLVTPVATCCPGRNREARGRTWTMVVAICAAPAPAPDCGGSTGGVGLAGAMPTGGPGIQAPRWLMLGPGSGVGGAGVGRGLLGQGQGGPRPRARARAAPSRRTSIQPPGAGATGAGLRGPADPADPVSAKPPDELNIFHIR